MAYLDRVQTASEVVASAGGGSTELEDDAWAAADTANVRHWSYINYAAQMTNYESRDDIETLAHRRAREAGDQFSDTDFTRAEGYDGT
jgi:hypothetical protein